MSRCGENQTGALRHRVEKWWLRTFPDPAAQLTKFRLMPNRLPPAQQPNDEQYRRRELTENPGGEDDDLVAHGTELSPAMHHCNEHDELQHGEEHVPAHLLDGSEPADEGLIKNHREAHDGASDYEQRSFVEGGKFDCRNR